MKRTMRRRFRVLVLLQTGFLACTIGALFWILLSTDFYAVPGLLAVLVTGQIMALLTTVQRHVEGLEEFFAAVNYQDFSRRFREDQLDPELAEAFNNILAQFRETRAERDLQATYLDTVVRHIPVPLLSERSDGRIGIINHPARRLTGVSNLVHLDDLSQISTGLVETLRELPSGARSIVQTRLRGIPAELRVSVAVIRQGGEVERLYAIENLSVELSERESNAWRNLIRVLTHEMMNTLTPLTSLAQTAATMLDEPEAREDVREALATIDRRGAGLMRFVSRFRDFLQVPMPEFQPVPVQKLLDSVLHLQKAALEGTEVAIEITPASLTVDADQTLLEQVLINIVKNACDAMIDTPSPTLTLRAYQVRGRSFIVIEDNGPGISENIRDQIFIPFFTTRKTGSGIGLPLSRQIMNAHGGDIVVEPTKEGCGTRMSLIFG